MISTAEALGARVLRGPARASVAAAAWLALLAWVRPLASPDEGRHADIARWMAESGDWLVPRMNGLPFLHKPPLYFWLEAVVIKTLGITPFVGRIVPLASAVLMCVCVFWLVRRFHDEHAARWSVAALLFNPLLYGGAQFANLDMLVAALITATLTFAVFAVHTPRTARRLWLAAYVAAALAVLAKGLIGVALPGLVFVIWALASRRPDWLLEAISPLGLLAFAIIVLPWFVAVEQEFPGFIQYFFGHHHFQRYVDTGFNNARGIWFYPVVLLVCMLPWTVAPLMHWRTALKAPAERGSLRLLGLIWFAVVLVFFSLPSSKLVGYMFPVLPAFAILVGPWFASYRYRLTTVAIGASLCIVALFVAAYMPATGPIGLAAKFKTSIAPDDTVVFIDGYMFDVAVILDRRKPIYVAGDWSRRSTELPDNMRRQFTEGREFDPKAGSVLIGREGLQALLSQSKPIWIWAETAALPGNPDLGALTVVASQGRFVLLRSRE
jgi:4-amino-4-deoxy-L-arabinose transferase-like glycosyltransferase